ncbi:ankyrin repeat-containing domain protein [Mycena olivaceomarginata]|nr:ankyrin repeat-containing domain protein [Mycena olivaceomarginata]
MQKEDFMGQALEAAVRWGHTVLVGLIITRGADIEIQDSIYKWIVELVQLLIEKEANVNAWSVDLNAWPDNLPWSADVAHASRVLHYRTALQAAVGQGHEVVADILLKNGADVNAPGGYLGTALQAASMAGYGALVQLLLEHGADVNAVGGQIGQSGSVLEAASVTGHEAIVLLLIENGAKHLIEKGADLNVPAERNIPFPETELYADLNQHGQTSFGYVAAYSLTGYNSFSELLIENPVGITMQFPDGGTIIHMASDSGNETLTELRERHSIMVHIGGNYPVVQLLIEEGANVKAKTLMAKDSRAALHWAALSGHDSVVQLLLDKGRDFGTALHSASAKGHASVVRLLIEKGANINAQGGKYRTALQAAAFEGHTEVVQLLIENGVDVKSREGSMEQHCGQQHSNNMIQWFSSLSQVVWQTYVAIPVGYSSAPRTT